MANLDNNISSQNSSMNTMDELGVDNQAIREILPALLTLQNNKESFYGESWRKYEDVGAFLNLARKWDRIDNIMRNAMKSGTEGLFDGSNDLSTETILDTIVDLSLYGLMWSSYIARRYPELWDKFLKMNDLMNVTEGS